MPDCVGAGTSTPPSHVNPAHKPNAAADAARVRDIINNEIAKKEDLSITNFDSQAAQSALIKTYPNAATPFSTEVLNEKWPPYRGMSRKVSTSNVVNKLITK